MPSPSPAPSVEIERLRDALAAAGRRLGARGLISATEGNISVRLDATTLLVTPAGHRKDELKASDLVVVPLRAADAGAGDGGASGPRPSSDIAIHRAAYEARADVIAVVHAHLPASMALTLAGEAPDPAALPETAMFLPRLPLVPFAAPGSPELAAGVAAALAAGPLPLPGAVLLERHGAVAVGGVPAVGTNGDARTARALASVDQAVDRLELIEVLCRAWRDALLIRAAAIGR